MGVTVFSREGWVDMVYTCKSVSVTYLVNLKQLVSFGFMFVTFVQLMVQICAIYLSIHHVDGGKDSEVALFDSISLLVLWLFSHSE